MKALHFVNIVSSTFKQLSETNVTIATTVSCVTIRGDIKVAVGWLSKGMFKVAQHQTHICIYSRKFDYCAAIGAWTVTDVVVVVVVDDDDTILSHLL